MSCLDLYTSQDPNLLLRRQRGFVLLVHVPTELGPISVEFRLLD